MLTFQLLVIESSGSSTKIGVVLLAIEWGSKRGSMSTFIRRLAIELAKHPEVHVSVFLPRCDEEEKNEAQRGNVTLVQATEVHGYDECYCLCFPPDDLHIDFVIGNGIELGQVGQWIQESRNCKWVQFMHTDPKEWGIFSGHPYPISNGQASHQLSVKLVEKADLVVAVGAKLAESFRRYLRFCDVYVFTPGIFSEFSNVQHGSEDRRTCQILAFGTNDAEGFTSTGVCIAANAVACLNDAELTFACANKKQSVQVNDILKRCFQPAIPQSNRRVHVITLPEDLEELKEMFSSFDLAIVPSEGGGHSIAALEAFSSGLRVLVNAKSGFGEDLQEVLFSERFLIQSEDKEEWAKAIQNAWAKERKNRLSESRFLRDGYDVIHNWRKQCSDLVEKMKGKLNNRTFHRPGPSKP